MIPCSLFGLAILIWTFTLSFNGLGGCSRLFLQGSRSQVGRFVNSKAEEYILSRRFCQLQGLVGMICVLSYLSACLTMLSLNFQRWMLILLRDFPIDHDLLELFRGSHSHWILLYLHVVKSTMKEIDTTSHLHERYFPAQQIVINRTQDGRMTILIPGRKRITHSPNIPLHTVNHPLLFVLNELPLQSQI